ncbi:MAG: hypothetical protein LC777_11175 [Actinobacteria bacterium]|nr:hypothetical protein [Actinomycetota bacterium]
MSRPSRSSILGGLLVAALVAPTLLYAWDPSDRERVEAYCAYGAASAAQWLGCVDHVTIDKVRAIDSRAAR